MLKTFLAAAVLLYVPVLCMLNADAQPSPEYDAELNVVDAKGFRQGYWKLMAGMFGYSYPWQPAQIVCEGNYTRSKEEGMWEWFHTNGAKAAEINYLNGRRNGVTNYYSTEGKLTAEVPFIAGVRYGVAKTYYPDGTLWVEMTWKDNRLFGPMTTYYPNGKMCETGEWQYNRWKGQYQLNDEHGNSVRNEYR